MLAFSMQIQRPDYVVGARDGEEPSNEELREAIQACQGPIETEYSYSSMADKKEESRLYAFRSFEMS